ncbi:LacI family DNA-binding transcriptional regulator [uncultured Varibaculum sp.]|uniref:LacI family DNA-binding transcriptional regulator n=1 Tax=uncultured Varibaculum sp. TaxID=413896 RepID=UPI002804B264|nr:LacI family DNA-binding transcriptional regulator [uncultured Varibaculum sp.]
MKQKITISDVAKEVGAAISTVSVALSGRPGVSEKRRAEIQRASFEMGYRPDRQAALIRLDRSYLLGVVYYMEQEFQISLMDPLFRYAEKQGYRLVATGCVGQRSEMDCIESLMQDRCEGIVLIGTRLSAEYLEKIAAVIPLITLCQEVGSHSVDAVVSNDAYGISKSFEHLWQKGFRDIVHIRGDNQTNANVREATFKQCLADRGLAADDSSSLRIYQGGQNLGDGARVADQILRQVSNGERVMPRAVICFNDLCAQGFMIRMWQEGVHIPQEIAVVGFDDTPIASEPYVELTTVRQDREELASLAVERLVEHVEFFFDKENYGKKWDAVEKQVETRLIVRKTA